MLQLVFPLPLKLVPLAVPLPAAELNTPGMRRLTPALTVAEEASLPREMVTSPLQSPDASSHDWFSYGDTTIAEMPAECVLITARDCLVRSPSDTPPQ